MTKFSISNKIYDSKADFIEALYKEYSDKLNLISSIIGEQIDVTDLHILLEKNKDNNYDIRFMCDGSKDQDLHSELSSALKYVNINRVVFGYAKVEGDEAAKLINQTLNVLNENNNDLRGSIEEVNKQMTDITKRVGSTGDTSDINRLTNEFNRLSLIFEMLLNINKIEAYKAGLVGLYKCDDEAKRTAKLDSPVIINALSEAKIMNRSHLVQVYSALEERLYKVIKNNDYDLYRAVKDKACLDKEWKLTAITALIVSEQTENERDLILMLSLLDDNEKNK